MGILFRLSLRQMLSPRRLLILLFIAAVPVALSAIARLAPPGDPDEFRESVLMGPFVISAVMPIVTVVLATASLGHEVEDRTFSYLFLKPVARWQIAAPKIAAAALVSALLVLGSGTLTAIIAPGGGAMTSIAIAGGLLVGVLAYTSVFVWAGLMTSYALPLGLVYVFLWEAAIVQFMQGVRWLSIRHYTLATIHGLDDVQFAGDAAMLDLAQALPAAGIVIVLFVTLTVRRIMRMDVP